MSNQVVLITGALTGIGRATAVAFANEKATVVISGRHVDEGQKLAAELRTLGTNAEFVQADVRLESDIQNLVDHTVSRFGKLDVAVNNAGTEGKPGPFTDQTAESYAATFDTNVLGTSMFPQPTEDRGHPVLRSMLAASTQWRVSPKLLPSNLPRPESASTSSLPGRSRPGC
jgi:NAD(P)-dependent dehydrogenase (short-subunit alcohol dehydrogenase family)